mgnify:FL=1
MFWAGIMYGRRTPLIAIERTLTSAQYWDRILQPIVVPYRQAFGDNFVFQDDNEHSHHSRLVNTFIHQAQINRMEWLQCLQT